jgi:Protein tyrosine and serine/threonine kinase
MAACAAPPHPPVSLLTYTALGAGSKEWSEQLGSGSFGDVYGGVLELAGRRERIACKRFRNRDTATDSFLRELAVTAAVQHENLLSVIAMVRPQLAVPLPSSRGFLGTRRLLLCPAHSSLRCTATASAS